MKNVPKYRDIFHLRHIQQFNFHRTIHLNKALFLHWGKQVKTLVII